MKNTFKKAGFAMILLLSLHFPLLFAHPVIHNETAYPNVVPVSDNYVSAYESLGLEAAGLSRKAFDAGMKGFEKLKSAGKLVNDHIISIADFTKSSKSKRLFIIDLDQQKVLYKTYVAHGQGSGEEFAKRFSNIPESLQSSPGFYSTTTTYEGKHGYSLKLQGLEKGINDKADQRAIVVHGADYVSERFIRDHGYLGRSWGCPAIPENLHKPIINTIKNGSLLFIYSENQGYTKKSRILNS